MFCVIAKYFKKKIGDKEYEMKAYAIDDVFTIEIKNNDLNWNHGYTTSIKLDYNDAEILRNQLGEFLNVY